MPRSAPGPAPAGRHRTSPRCRPQEARDNVEERRLAAARRAEHRDHLAGADLQRHPFERVHAAPSGSAYTMETSSMSIAADSSAPARQSRKLASTNPE